MRPTETPMMSSCREEMVSPPKFHVTGVSNSGMRWE